MKLTTFLSGTLEVEEVDRQAILEMSKMLKVSNKISGLKALNDNTRSNVAKEIEATAEAETGEASEADSSKSRVKRSKRTTRSCLGKRNWWRRPGGQGRQRKLAEMMEFWW